LTARPRPIVVHQNLIDQQLKYTLPLENGYGKSIGKSNLLSLPGFSLPSLELFVQSYQAMHKQVMVVFYVVPEAFAV